MLPPVHLYRQGEPARDVLRIIAGNSRTPDKAIGDVHALVAGVNVIGRRLDELDRTVRRRPRSRDSRRNGSTAASAGCATSCAGFPRARTTGASPSKATASWRVSATRCDAAVTLDDGAIDIDFAGTSQQSGGAINASFSQTMSGVIYAVRCLVDPSIPMNEGCFRAVHGAAPTRDARQPEPARRVRRARHQRDRGDRGDARRARAGACPIMRSRPSALIHVYSLTGVDADGRRWVSLFYDFGGIGGRARRRRARRHRLLLPRWALGDPADRAAGGAVPVRRAALAPAPRLRRRRRSGAAGSAPRSSSRCSRPPSSPCAATASSSRHPASTAVVPVAPGVYAVERADGSTEVLSHEAGRHPPRRRGPLRHAHLGRRRSRAAGGAAARGARRRAERPRHARAGRARRTTSTRPTNGPTNELRVSDDALVRGRRRGRHVHRRRARQCRRRLPRRQGAHHTRRPARRRHRRRPARARAAPAVAPGDVSRVVHGTTLATNVILEQKGSPLAFVVTEGFADLLRLGREARVEDDRYDLFFTTPAPPVDPQPHVRSPRADHGRRQRAARAVRRAPPPTSPGRSPRRRRRPSPSACSTPTRTPSTSAPSHARCATALPDAFVVASTEVWPEMREYERAMTTVMCAYVGPVMAGYLARPRSAARRAGHRRAARDHGFERRRDVGVARGPPAGADARVRRRRGRHRGRSRRAAHRRTRRDLVRHGRHHGQGRHRARRPPGTGHRLPGRRQGQLRRHPRRYRVPREDHHRRPRRGRRRWREHRVDRRRRRTARRPPVGGRGAGPGVLRARRHRSDRHRRRPPARLPRSRRPCRWRGALGRCRARRARRVGWPTRSASRSPTPHAPSTTS